MFEATYNIAGVGIATAHEEKDLCVTTDLGFETTLHSVATKANSILGVIRRYFSYLTEKNTPLLFKALVRLHVEYAHAVWHPPQEKTHHHVREGPETS